MSNTLRWQFLAAPCDTLTDMDDATLNVDAPNKPPRRFRRMRIAVSAFFGVLTLALCVLWVRSYWLCDFVFRCDMMGPYSKIKVLGSEGGYVYFKSDIQLGGPGTMSWQPVIGEPASPVTYRWVNERRSKMFMVAYFYLMPIMLAVTAVPWIRFSGRCSLRTQLVATMLLAVLLVLVCFTGG